MNIYISSSQWFKHSTDSQPLAENWASSPHASWTVALPWGPSRRVPGGRSNDGAEKGWENHGKTIKNLWKIRGFLMFLGFFGLKKISKYQVKQRHTSKIRMPCSAKKRFGGLVAGDFCRRHPNMHCGNPILIWYNSNTTQCGKCKIIHCNGMLWLNGIPFQRPPHIQLIWFEISNSSKQIIYIYVVVVCASVNETGETNPAISISGSSLLILQALNCFYQGQ